MRRITRNAVLALVAIVVLLLALGALPGYLKSGDPYHLTATELDNGSLNDSEYNASDAIPAENLTEQRYPFSTRALANRSDGVGYSDPYWEGPFGIKGTFTHSPFDELSSLEVQYPNASDGETALVLDNGTYYRLNTTQP
ncbi:hypothetical protein GJ629_09465 [Halapricum sp. CBA1109]|jgi:hypothetical protein|uniref:hypothetical protein n=1 Tax=Halapricum sp. CBA1109 TaxID=2668068 RepID=UPI0012FCD9AC|nr:hypothetical protein [Halapricum sp. CBA1109]MUV90090.1 hypothetical protein [Halapricum sp. CBA1109]